MLNDYSPELENAVLSELENGKYNLAICDFMQSTLNFKRIKDLPILLFQHNVEAAIAQRHMQRAKDPLMRTFWWLQFKKMFFHEKQQCHRFDSVIAVSENDKKLMESWYKADNVYEIPTGVDTEFFAPQTKQPEKRKLLFVGAMDWLPNHDAMLYFLEKIWPLIRKKAPDTEFTIVGKNPSPKLQRIAAELSNVTVTGWVDDTRPYIAESAVFIVPIRIGGGTRMKIYQGMSMEKAIVSTTIGAEGLPLIPGKHIIIADSDKDFANEVIQLLENEIERKNLGDAARQYVYENFRWEKVADVFIDVCHKTSNGKA
ncbi:MAG: glycosyltransferase family 4 protein [Calditrichia bacterium]